MTSQNILKAGKRNKADRKSAEKVIPAILYGRTVENVPVWVGSKEFREVYNECGESAIFTLDIGGDKRNVLIKDVQFDTLSDIPVHADFYQVRMDEEIEADIELVFIGESPAVKENGGVLVKSLDAISVRCLPGDLPADIEINVAALKTFDDVISVSDIKLSDKVEVLIDPETVIASVMPPRSEEELADLEKEVETDVSKVEVLEEKKKEDGEADESMAQEEKK